MKYTEWKGSKMLTGEVKRNSKARIIRLLEKKAEKKKKKL